MNRQPRVKGGEKNLMSGRKWTEVELARVLKLYVEDRSLKIQSPIH